MAAANDNQGLKIAVAALVMLVFILGVTNYFAFSNASQNFAQKEAETKKASDAAKQARDNLEAANYYRTVAGYPNLEELDAAKAAITKHQQAIATDIAAIGAETNQAVTTVQKAGSPDPKLDDLKTVGAGLVSAFASEPNENRVYSKTVDRLKDLLVNQSRLMREISLDYRKLRMELASANSTNSVEVAKAIAARDKALQEKQAEIDRFKSDLQSLNDHITSLQSSDKEKTNQITDLTNKFNDETQKLARTKVDLGRMIQELRDKLALNYNNMPAGKAIGRVTYVDHNRGEAHVSVRKSDGARPMMRFAIFDRDAQGIPSDKPKGIIELISVGDTDSIAKITETKNPVDPIRYNDQLYSPAMTPDGPERYALIGRMDINRDGKDDRAELIRLIEASGGLIEYDLAPPGSDRSAGRLAVERTFNKIGEPVPPHTGLSWGRISRAKAYVIDTRQTTLSGDNTKDGSGLTAEDVAYNKERSDATKEARAVGVPPIELRNLLMQLGYSAPPPGFGKGSVESKNKGALKQLLKPKPIQPGANAPGLEKDPAAPAAGTDGAK
jgi:flagellar motility protein MotE (MotC chaperone)